MTDDRPDDSDAMQPWEGDYEAFCREIDQMDAAEFNQAMEEARENERQH